ncbi:MAG: hypothetical protein ABIR46_03590 [Candidatus Saccharimonadales bacterium]
MFPPPEHAGTHKSSASRRKNEEIKLSRRASEIMTPDELVSFIIEIADKKYCQGHRVITFSVIVPIQNFKTWAISTKIVSHDMDQLDRQTIRKEVTRIVRGNIKRQLMQGTYLTLDSGIAGDQRLSFKVRFNIVKHS